MADLGRGGVQLSLSPQLGSGQQDHLLLFT